MTSQMTDPDAIRTFVFAGRAVFTLVSKATGARFTFKVVQSKDENGPFFVSLLTGPENTTDFSYLGCVFPPKTDRLVHTKKSWVGKDAPSWLAMAWFLRRLELAKARDDALDQIEFWHTGHCGRCGRTLTVPESVATGIGPVCAGM